MSYLKTNDNVQINKLFTSVNRILENLKNNLDKHQWKYIFLTLCFLKIINKIIEKNNKFSRKWIINSYYNWNFIVLCAKKNKNNIAEIIDETLLRFESENSDFLNKAKLWRKFVSIFKNQQNNLSKIVLKIEESTIFETIYDNKENNDNFDILAHIYEKFLNQYGKWEKTSSGKFYTPISIVKLIANILCFYFKNLKIEKKSLDIYDPTVGSGGMFIQGLKIFNELKGSKTFFGQEKDFNTCQFGKINLSLYNIYFQLKTNDTITSPCENFPEYMDLVLSNPPFNAKKTSEYLDIPDINGENIVAKYNLENDLTLNFYFMCHIIEKLSKAGKGAILLDLNSATTPSSHEARKSIINKDVIDIIIKLPNKIFTKTNINALLYILNKNKTITKDKILFINAKKECKTKNKIVYLGKQNITNILNYVQDYLNNNHGKFPIYKKAHIATIKDIKKNNYNLKIEKYIPLATEEKIDSLKYKDITNNLKEQIDDVNMQLNSFQSKFNEIQNLEEFINKIKNQNK